MKRSLLALLLALVMCLSLFMAAGCAKEEEEKLIDDSQKETAPITLTLYAPTKSTTTQDQVELVQAAFNNITQSKFNTNVILKLIPEDEYADTIKDTLEKIHKQKEEEEAAEESRLQAEKDAILRGEELPEETEPEETVDENADSDNPQITYPAERENQLDIFLVNSFETYYNLAAADELYPLDEELSANSKLLNSYIYPYLLRAAKVDGSTYGIFNNTVFGNYQYLLLNKELVDKYEYDPEEMSDLASISMFLNEVKKNEADVIPFLGEIEDPVVYWDDTESVIGAFVGSAMSASGKVDATSYRPEALYPGSLFNSSGYRAWWTEYNKLYQNDCIVEKTDANKDAKFAATIIEGDVTLSPTYADVYGNYKVDEFGFKYITDENGVDYYVSVYKRPMADNENVFNAGFVVSAYTENVTRCMQIITCLNTDAALSNIFMYGVEDVHYTVDEVTKVVHKTTDKYAMDITSIGNIYLLKPSDDMSEYWQFMSKNGWENAKNTNREAIMSPFLGFYFNPEIPLEEDLLEGQVMPGKTFKDLYAEAVTLSKPYLEQVRTFRDNPETPDQTFDRFLLASRASIGEDPVFDQFTDYEKGIYYMLGPYNEWYQRHYGVTLGLG